MKPKNKKSEKREADGDGGGQEQHHICEEEVVDEFYEFNSGDGGGEKRMRKKSSSGSTRVFARRRSISLNSEDQEVARMIRQLQAEAEASVAGKEGEDEEEEEASTPPSGEEIFVRMRAHVPVAPPRGGRQRSDSPAVKRPSSMLVHDNEELLLLAEELQGRDEEERRGVVSFAVREALTPTPTPRMSCNSGRSRRDSSKCAIHGGGGAADACAGGVAAGAAAVAPVAVQTKATSSLVRRNSSGYGSGSASNSRSSTLNSGTVAADVAQMQAATADPDPAVRGAKKSMGRSASSMSGPPPPAASTGVARRGSVMTHPTNRTSATAAPRAIVGGAPSSSNDNAVVVRRSSVCIGSAAAITASAGGNNNLPPSPSPRMKSIANANPSTRPGEQEVVPSPSLQPQQRNKSVVGGAEKQQHHHHHHKTSRLNLGSLFGSSGKRSSVHGHGQSGGAQGKIVKKYERQISGSNSSNVKAEEAGSHHHDKRSQFLQAGRSSTGLNLFGARRRSIAITDDAYNAAIRSAKSHVDLSQVGVPPTAAAVSPAVAKKPGPGLSELREEKKPLLSPPLPVAAPSPSLSMARAAAAATGLGEACKEGVASRLNKIGSNLKDRSWTELERLWKAKAREPPNIEGMFKSRSSFRNDGNKADRSVRAKTIPMTGGEGVPPSAAASKQKPHPDWKQQNWSPPPFSSGQHRRQHHFRTASSPSTAATTPTAASAGSPKLFGSRLTLPPGGGVSFGDGGGGSDGGRSPAAARKAIDLLAPHVFSAWQREQGHPPIYQRYQSLPASVAAAAAAAAGQTGFPHSRSHSSDYFDELVKAW